MVVNIYSIKIMSPEAVVKGRVDELREKGGKLSDLKI
jgi:hypothetical protein